MSVLFDFPHFSQRSNTICWSLILMVVSVLPYATGRDEIRKYLHKTLNHFALLTFALCAIVLVVDTTHWSILPEFLCAMVTPQRIPTEILGKGTVDLIVAVTLMGLGGWSCIFYTSLCAMARQGLAGAKDDNDQYLVAFATGLRGTQTRLACQQPALAPVDSPESRAEYSRWIRLAWIDASIGTGGNLLTTAVLCFLAFAMLHDTGNIPSASWDLLSAQAEFFRPVLGSLALPTFLVLGGVFLLDTWLGFGSLLSGLMADSLPKLAPRLSKLSVNTLFYACLGIFVLQSILTVCLQPPGNLIRITAISLNLSTPVLCVILLYLNYIYLPRVLPSWVRPTLLSAFLLAISFVCYTGLAIWYIVSAFF